MGSLPSFLPSCYAVLCVGRRQSGTENPFSLFQHLLASLPWTHTKGKKEEEEDEAAAKCALNSTASNGEGWVADCLQPPTDRPAGHDLAISTERDSNLRNASRDISFYLA